MITELQWIRQIWLNTVTFVFVFKSGHCPFRIECFVCHSSEVVVYLRTSNRYYLTFGCVLKTSFYSHLFFWKHTYSFGENNWPSRVCGRDHWTRSHQCPVEVDENHLVNSLRLPKAFIEVDGAVSCSNQLGAPDHSWCRRFKLSLVELSYYLYSFIHIDLNSNKNFSNFLIVSISFMDTFSIWNSIASYRSTTIMLLPV